MSKIIDIAPLWRVAKQRKRLSRKVVDLIKKDNYYTKTPSGKVLVSIDKKHMRVNTINRAWSNPKTTNEAAFFVIASRFGNLQELKGKKSTGIPSDVTVRLVADSKVPGDVYFKMVRMNENFQTVEFKPTKSMTRFMMYYRTPRGENVGVINALLTGDVNQQDLSLWVRDTSEFPGNIRELLDDDDLCEPDYSNGEVDS